jgi:hypothetical protein
MESQSIFTPLPGFFIGKDLTYQRISNYISQKHGLLTQALGRPDTRSVWYAKEHLNQLLQEIENVRGDGLRIFFGAYESSHEYAGQTCLLMVVTRAEAMSDGQISHQNVVIEEEVGYKIRKEATKDLTLEDDDLFDKPKDFNHGSPCPPLCDYGEGFEYP